MNGFIIAGTQSGCGKTTVTLGITAALVGRGLKVAPFKTGPDFIDPGHHVRATGSISRNLDGWMLSRQYNDECFKKHAAQADIAVVEGVMGLFDGYDGKSDAGSTAQMAKWLDLPVVLVIDARSMARSAAALVKGFKEFDKDLTFAGVVFNRMGSKQHLAYLKEAVAQHTIMPCLGGIMHDQDLTIPERHLGLTTSQDHLLSDQFFHKLVHLIETGIDMDALSVLSPIGRKVGKPGPPPTRIPHHDRVRIGAAKDNAFCFYYQDNLEMLEHNGAELRYFSPLQDQGLPDDLDGIYLGGGYPELFAKPLADNVPMRQMIKEAGRKGMPVYGECGGLIYLCREIYDLRGNAYPMTGCFPYTVKMFPKLQSLGYREITTDQDTPIGRRGMTARGHEFRYSDIVERRDQKTIRTVYQVTARKESMPKKEGYQINNTLGSYIHLHFGSNPDIAANFVESCRKYNRLRKQRPAHET